MVDVLYPVGTVASCMHENYRIIGFVPCGKKSEKWLAQRKTVFYLFIFIKPWPFSELLRIRDKIIHIKGLAPYLANKCIVNIDCCCYSIVMIAKKLFNDWY